MVYITGDTHGDSSLFKSKQYKKLKKGDTLIICGDFGYIWDESEKETKFLKWIGKRKYTTLFVDGTHENFPLLNNYPTVEYKGGNAKQISGNLYYLLRGEVFTIEDEKYFTFGGGNSLDKEYRISQDCWWNEEIPTMSEMQKGVENLKANGNEVDYIITHQPTAKIITQLNGSKKYDATSLDLYLDEIAKNIKFKLWFFGSIHIDKKVSYKYLSIFKLVVPVKDKAPKRLRKG